MHRDSSKVISSLEKLENVAISKNNLMPHIINAVKSRATLGEISDALRKIFGEY